MTGKTVPEVEWDPPWVWAQIVKRCTCGTLMGPTHSSPREQERYLWALLGPLLPLVVPKAGCHYTEHLALRWLPPLSALCLPLPACTYEASGRLWAALAVCIASHWICTCFFCFLREHWFSRAFGGHRILGLSLALSYEERLSLCWCGFIFPVLLLGLFLWVCLHQRKSSAFRFWLSCHTYYSSAYPSLPIRLHFADDISKPPELPFLIPKGYFKWNQKQEYPSPVLNYVGSQKKPPFLWFHW